MGNRNIKVTYVDGERKLCVYIRERKETYSQLYQQIKECLLQRDLPYSDYRLYWIDSDGDQIDIINQDDLLVFAEANGEKAILMVSPVIVEAANSNNVKANVQENVNRSQEAAGSPKANSEKPNFVHDRVECDVCGMNPIVGFRYRCFQCPNYDLCSNCEAEFKHPEHMMMRMPKDCNDVITIRGLRHRFRRANNSAVFSNKLYNNKNDAPDGNFEADFSGNKNSTGPTDKKKTSPTSSNGKGFFSSLYEMMNDLAEGGSVATSQNATTNENVSCAFKMAEKAAEAATVAAAQALAATQLHTADINSDINKNASAQEASTSVPQNEPPKQDDNNAQSGNNNESDNTVPVLNSPNLDNLMQQIDPHYMKQGIQIMNNFSNLFAKMLDSMESVGSVPTTSCRTSDCTSTASGTDTPSSQTKATATENSTKEVGVGPNDIEIQSQTQEQNAQENEKASSNRSFSSDDDWLMLGEEQTPNTTTDASDVGLKETQTPVNYEQLSNDLRAHLEMERMREEKSKSSASTESKPNAPNPATSTPSVTPVAAENLERRFIPVYHHDEHINTAILTMMAMGFSNEGSDLTQLLETVDGNIDQALDLMCRAQNNSNM